jgi:hypothetical protein
MAFTIATAKIPTIAAINANVNEIKTLRILSILPPLPSLWLRLMRLEPLPRSFLYAGQRGRRQVRRDFVSDCRIIFRIRGVQLASSR